MTTLVKKQHYVWQYMLQPWTIGGKIACLRQADKRAFETGTGSVANETFFYKSSELTPQDREYIERIIAKSPHQALRDINRETVAMFQRSHQIRALLQRLPADSAQRTEVEAKLAIIDKTLGESYQSLFEGRARHLIDRLKESDCEFYRTSNHALEFINFISHQFTRSPKFRALAMSLTHAVEGLDLTRTWLIESHIYATNIAFGLFADKDKYKFLFLNNFSSVPFITGDVPIINLNEQSNTDLRMYYPLSPTHAFVYGVDASIDFCQSEDIEDSQAVYLNERIYGMSVDQIYCNSLAQAQSYIGRSKGS